VILGMRIYSKCGCWALQRVKCAKSAMLDFFLRTSERPAAIRHLSSLAVKAVAFSSNLARKKWRLEGNRETGETVAEETKTAKSLRLQDFPMTLEKIS
jgi:hypothetical protein